MSGRVMTLMPIVRKLAARPGSHWCCQFTMICGIGLWVALDPLFPANALGLPHETVGLPHETVGLGPTTRWFTLHVLLLLALLQLASLICGLVVGSRRFRSLKSSIVVVTLVGLWMSLGASHMEVAWQGKRARLAWRLQEFESLARSLSENWPSEDGEHAALGPFMAYPLGRPQTLILLTPPSIDSGGTVIAAVERRDSGSLMFQLTGSASQRDWMEWHPSDSPVSFVGGLQDEHELERSAALSNGWHLVRYES